MTGGTGNNNKALRSPKELHI